MYIKYKIKVKIKIKSKQLLNNNTIRIKKVKT